MKKKKIDLTLYGEQTTIFNDWLNTNKNCMDILPAGSGKTFMSSFLLPIAASDVKYHKNRDVVYFAPTREMIKTLIWEDLKKTCRDYFNIPESNIHNSDLTIKFPNGIFIRCKSAEVKENLRGMNIGLGVLDEAALFHGESLLEITNRLRPKPNDPDSVGRMIVITTPNGTNELYKLYKNTLNLDNWITRHYTYQQMRVSDKKFIETQRKILSPLKFAKDYLCSFESVEDKFFMSWDKTMCKPVEDNGGDLYSFHDFNSKRMCAIIARVSNRGKLEGKIEVIKTYAIPNCSTEELCKLIREDFPRRNIFSIIDATGSHNNRSTTSVFGVTDKTVMEKYGFTILNTKRSNPLIKDTDNSSNAFIARNGLVVDINEKLLLEALDNYHYETADRLKLVKYTEQEYAHIDALGDCLRYGIHHLFPINHSEISMPDYVTSDSKFFKSPGDKYKSDSPLYPGGPSFSEIIEGSNIGDQDYVTW